jgi:cold shock CspA family protein
VSGVCLLVGRVVTFDPDAGLGVVTAGDGGVYRFHCVEIADGTRSIEADTGVAFAVESKLGDHEAIAIHKLA